MRLTRIALVLAFLFFSTTSAFAHEVIHLYGPGGPAPAMKEAAEAFGKARGVEVRVTAGPSKPWMTQARKDADLVFSGSENMMTGFIRELKGVAMEDSVRPIYLRPSAILVRPGNPKKIAGVRDLLKPGVRILVVEGAGQVGLWEDVAGRLGDLATIRAFRDNIVEFSANSGDAKKVWTSRNDIDAWLIWNIWEIANDGVADAVEVEPELRIWRDCAIVLTKKGGDRPIVREFAKFLESDEGRAIFTRWGWK